MEDQHASTLSVPWWVNTVLLPLIFLGLNGYLVASTKKLEKTIEGQTQLLVRLSTLEARVVHLEGFDKEQQLRVEGIATEQQARGVRLAVLESGLRRLEAGQEQLVKRSEEIRDLLLRNLPQPSGLIGNRPK